MILSSIQVDAEMTPQFSRLGICDSHMPKKWRGTAPPVVAVLGSERRNGQLTACICSLDRDFVTSCSFGVTSRAHNTQNFS